MMSFSLILMILATQPSVGHCKETLNQTNPCEYTNSSGITVPATHCRKLQNREYLVLPCGKRTECRTSQFKRLLKKNQCQTDPAHGGTGTLSRVSTPGWYTTTRPNKTIGLATGSLKALNEIKEAPKSGHYASTVDLSLNKEEDFEIQQSILASESKLKIGKSQLGKEAHEYIERLAKLGFAYILPTNQDGKEIPFSDKVFDIKKGEWRDQTAAYDECK